MLVCLRTSPINMQRLAMATAPSRDLARLRRRDHAVDQLACLDRETGFHYAAVPRASNARVNVQAGDGRRSRSSRQRR